MKDIILTREFLEHPKCSKQVMFKHMGNIAFLDECIGENICIVCKEMNK